MADDLTMQISLGTNSYSAMLIVLKMARSCVASNTTFGNVLRYENAVDLNVLMAIETILEQDGATVPLDLDYVGISNVLVASDIVCKMFCCDAVDYVLKDLDVKTLDNIARNNIISYATTLIKQLANLEPFKDAIAALLEEIDAKIYPC